MPELVQVNDLFLLFVLFYHFFLASRLSYCALLDNTTLSNSCYVRDSIIGWECVLGSWVRVQDNCVLGMDIGVSDEVVLVNVKVAPHRSVKTSELSEKVIM
jgi:mannose-1-phosphate guanylyltransferase